MQPIKPPIESGYDCSEHVGWDLRLIADNTDQAAGYATLDANILRTAAAMLDGLPIDTSHARALELAREASAEERKSQ